MLTHLEQEKITVVQKIKGHIIQKIAECARCHIVDDILIILPNNSASLSKGTTSTNQSTKTYIGTLYSTNFKTFQFATKSKTFMFLEQSEKLSTYHVSLLITGPELEILKQFKKSLQGTSSSSSFFSPTYHIVYTSM